MVAAWIVVVLFWYGFVINVDNIKFDTDLLCIGCFKVVAVEKWVPLIVVTFDVSVGIAVTVIFSSSLVVVETK